MWRYYYYSHAMDTIIKQARACLRAVRHPQMMIQYLKRELLQPTAMLCKMYKKTVPTKRGNNKPLSTTGDMLPKCKQVTLLRAAVHGSQSPSDRKCKGWMEISAVVTRSKSVALNNWLKSLTYNIKFQFGSTLHVNIRGITFNTIILRSCLSEMVNRSIQSQSPCYVQPNDRSTSILTTCTIHHFSKHFIRN